MTFVQEIYSLSSEDVGNSLSPEEPLSLEDVDKHCTVSLQKKALA